MNTLRPFYAFGVIAATAMLLSACAETQFVMHTAKRLGETQQTEGAYKVGKPYQVDGVWYYPKEDWSYDQTGIASWYGPNFHSKTTANGEVFDQWSVSAAHKTLPMPSMVRVTNLENGRSLVVRVNDRGPFRPGRIIDLSHRAAQLLGFARKGTARVRVQILPRESQNLAARARAGGQELALADSPIKTQPPPSVPVVTQTLPAPQAEPVAPPPPAAVRAVSEVVAQAPVGTTRLYIQAGAFSNLANAERVKARLRAIGAVNITPVPVGGRNLFRVRLGPIADVAEADRLLNRVFEAGYAGARTVVVSTNDARASAGWDVVD